MKTKYNNDAIIGGKSITASYTKNGELLRVMYPFPDFRSWIDEFKTGVKINDSGIIYLHDDINNQYNQYYTEDTNILNTEILNTYFNLKIKQTDFALLKNSVLVKKYEFENKNNIELNVNFLIHSKLLTDYNNMVSGEVKDNTLIQYCHDYTMYTFSNIPFLSNQINNTKESISSGIIADKDYIGMSCDSSISYDVGCLKPNEKKELTIFLYFKHNGETTGEGLNKELAEIKKLDVKKEEQSVEKYWKKYVKDHLGIELKKEPNGMEKKFNQIYKRSILLFPLLINQETGGISAAVEIDEEMTKCGRYSYCWPRDAVFITRALDSLKMTKETEKFYKVFCKETQSKNGMWEQRFYTDKRLAPCWGYQVDETASVVYGVYNHYEYTKNEEFLKENLHMCELAITFLKKYVYDVLENTGKYSVSYDIWEENDRGIHMYSLASIFSAFDTMKKIYKALGKNVSDFENNRLKEEKINKNIKEIDELMLKVKEYIEQNLYDENRKSYVRNTEDRRIDISLLGAVYPFNVFSPKEKKVLNTVENINLTLRTYTGGYQRYENDGYRNGSPWPISNLWMTLYYLEIGEKKKAKETFDFVLKTVGKHSFLGEQVDNSTLKPNWVIGLGWSHAMFIIVLEKLSNIK